MNSRHLMMAVLTCYESNRYSLLFKCGKSRPRGAQVDGLPRALGLVNFVSRIENTHHFNNYYFYKQFFYIQ